MEASEPPSTTSIPAPRAGGLSVDIVCAAGAWDDVVDGRDLARALRAAFAARDWPVRDAEVALLLSDDAAVHRLNAAWRGKDQPTNVLSFPGGAPIAGEACHLGDIALAFETVAREAEEKNIPLRHHAAHLAVHGMLHLLGLDHGDDASAERMEALETAILASIGLPDPYAPELVSEASGGAVT